MPGESIAFQVVAEFVGEEAAEGIGDLVEQVKKLFEGLSRLAQAGDRATDVISHLGIGLGDAEAAVGGMVSKVDLAIAANRFAAAGAEVTGRQFGALARVARDYSEATGVGIPEAMERLTQSVIRGNERGLKPFGLSAGSVAEIMEQVTRRAEELGEVHEGAGDAFKRLEVSADELYEAFGRGVDSSETLANSIGGIGNALDAVETFVQGAGKAYGWLLGELLKTPPVSEEVAEAMREVEEATHRQADAFIESAEAVGVLTDDMNDYLNAVGQFRESELTSYAGPGGEAAGYATAVPTGFRATGGGEYSVRQRTDAARRRGGGRRKTIDEYEAEHARIAEDRRDLFDELQELGADEQEAEAQWQDERLASQQDFQDRMTEIQSEYHDNIREIDEAAAESRREIVLEEQRLREEQMNSALSWISVSGRIADSALTVFGGKESDRLVLKGIIAEGEGAAMLIGSLGTNPEGYAKVAEGIAYFALASEVGGKGGGGGRGYGGTSPRGGAGRGAGGYSSTGGPGTTRGGHDGPQTIVINNYGMLREREAADLVGELLDGRHRRGYPLRGYKAA